MENKILPIALVDMNEGQVPGLPRNPRTWTYADIERLKQSIRETPELMDARGIIVYPHNGRFVAVGGNMRLAALKSMGMDTAPCVILPDDMPADKLQEIVIKDNGTFGDWDADALMDEWGGCPFADWGIDVVQDLGADADQTEKAKQEDDPRKVFEVELTPKEFNFVSERLRMYNEVPELALLKLIGYGEE